MSARIFRILVALSFVSLPVSNCTGNDVTMSSCCCKGMEASGQDCPPMRMPCCKVEPAPDTSTTLPERVIVEKTAAVFHLPVDSNLAIPLLVSPTPRRIGSADTGPPGSLAPLRV